MQTPGEGVTPPRLRRGVPMLSSDDLQMIRAVVRQELTGLLHPSVRVTADVSALHAYVANATLPPANDTQPDQPPPDAA